MSNEQQQPSSIVCQECGDNPRIRMRWKGTCWKEGQRYHIFTCVYRHFRLVPAEQVQGQRISIQWNGNPPDAA